MGGAGVDGDDVVLALLLVLFVLSARGLGLGFLPVDARVGGRVSGGGKLAYEPKKGKSNCENALLTKTQIGCRHRRDPPHASLLSKPSAQPVVGVRVGDGKCVRRVDVLFLVVDAPCLYDSLRCVFVQCLSAGRPPTPTLLPPPCTASLSIQN